METDGPGDTRRLLFGDGPGDGDFPDDDEGDGENADFGDATESVDEKKDLPALLIALAGDLADVKLALDDESDLADVDGLADTLINDLVDVDGLTEDMELYADFLEIDEYTDRDARLGVF